MNPDYNKAATYAVVTLIKAGVDFLPVFPENLIRQCRNTRLMSYDEYYALPAIAEAFPDAKELRRPEALTHIIEYENERYWLTLYDRKLFRSFRWKFSMAHELGHIVMHHHGREPAEEAEADFFAAHLLLPRPLIAEMLEQDIPLLEPNLFNYSNVSKSCLRRMQESEAAYVDPKYNAALRRQLRPFLMKEIEANHVWMKGTQHTRLYTLKSYMAGYTE